MAATVLHTAPLPDQVSRHGTQFRAERERELDGRKRGGGGGGREEKMNEDRNVVSVG